MKKPLRVQAAAVLLLAATAGCSTNKPDSDSRTRSSADYMTYASVEHLTKTSQLAVTGAVTGVRTKQCAEAAAQGHAQPCRPIAFLHFKVKEVLKSGSGIKEGDEITVGNHETRVGDQEEPVSLTVGGQYALYLEHLGPGDHPDISTVSTFWVPVGGNQGIFTLEGSTVTSTSPELTALSAAEAAQPGNEAGQPARFTTTIAGLRDAAGLARRNP